MILLSGGTKRLISSVPLPSLEASISKVRLSLKRETESANDTNFYSHRVTRSKIWFL